MSKCIYTRPGWYGDVPCLYQAKYGEYCGIHNPDLMAARALRRKRGAIAAQVAERELRRLVAEDRAGWRRRDDLYRTLEWMRVGGAEAFREFADDPA